MISEVKKKKKKKIEHSSFLHLPDNTMHLVEIIHSRVNYFDSNMIQKAKSTLLHICFSKERFCSGRREK